MREIRERVLTGEMAEAVPDPIDLTHETYFEFVRNNKHAVIHFWASWNGHDVLMKRMIPSELPAELRDGVAFAWFDVDPPLHAEICRNLEVLNVPFLAFYRERKLVRTVTGMCSAETLKEYFRDILERDEE